MKERGESAMAGGQGLWKLMEQPSLPFGRWDFGELWGLGRGRDAMENDIFFVAFCSLSIPKTP